MVMLRHPNPPFRAHPSQGATNGCAGGVPNADGGRLNLLLSSGDWREDDWADLLPRLLEPLGVNAIRVGSGHEATALLQRTPVHIAVVDLALPLNNMSPVASAIEEQEGGYRLLEMLGRLPCPPPTLVVKRRKTRRDDARARGRPAGARLRGHRATGPDGHRPRGDAPRADPLPLGQMARPQYGAEQLAPRANQPRPGDGRRRDKA
ncbi:MAG: hypothetical protein ACFHWZ_04405 [Phycisphaerales bacterium]